MEFSKLPDNNDESKKTKEPLDHPIAEPKNSSKK